LRSSERRAGVSPGSAASFFGANPEAAAWTVARNEEGSDAFIALETTQWAKVIREAGVKAD